MARSVSVGRHCQVGRRILDPRKDREIQIELEVDIMSTNGTKSSSIFHFMDA